jgi:hypothetical protein
MSVEKTELQLQEIDIRTIRAFVIAYTIFWPVAVGAATSA